MENIFMYKIKLLFLSLFLSSCLMPGTPSIDDPKPIDPVIPDTDSNVTYTCSTAENRVQELCSADSVKNEYCCEVVKPTLKGKSFSEFCLDIQQDGVDLNVSCLSNITSCSQIDVCTNSK